MPVLLPVLPAVELALLPPGIPAPGMVPPGGIAPGVMVPLVVLLVVPGVTAGVPPIGPEEGVGAGVGIWLALMLPEGCAPLAAVPRLAAFGAAEPGLACVVLPGLVAPGPVMPIGGAMVVPRPPEPPPEPPPDAPP
jgi:hypothetical protein